MRGPGARGHRGCPSPTHSLLPQKICRRLGKKRRAPSARRKKGEVSSPSASAEQPSQCGAGRGSRPFTRSCFGRCLREGQSSGDAVADVGIAVSAAWPTCPPLLQGLASGPRVGAVLGSWPGAVLRHGGSGSPHLLHFLLQDEPTGKEQEATPRPAGIHAVPGLPR